MKNKENNSKQNLIIALLSILVLLVIIVIAMLSKPKEVEKQEETIVSTTETTTESTEVENDTEDTEDDKISEIVPFYTTDEIQKSNYKSELLFNGINISYKDGWEFFCMLGGKAPKEDMIFFVISFSVLNEVFKNFECSIALLDEVNNPDKELQFYKIVVRDEEIISQVVPSEWEELDQEEIKNNLNTKESNRIKNDIIQAIANVIKKCDEQGETGFLDDIKDKHIPN